MLLIKTIFLTFSIIILPLEARKNKTTENSYDFIIIGSGTAGSVVASRLAENPTFKILLLEAGNVAPIIARIPSITPVLQQAKQYSWNYESQPEKTIFKSLKNHSIHIPLAKTLGGCSTNNFMIYSRGNPEDYNNWEKLGNPGWNYNSILKYFLKSEGSSLEFQDQEFHNKTGPLSVEYSATSDSSITFLTAAEELGYNLVDYNGKTQKGFSSIQATVKKGARFSTAQAYLDSTKKRDNLKIQLSAEVTKILFNSKGKRATAVKYKLAGKNVKATATKEIILSAGVFNTPKLLKLSGIGPEKELTSLSIQIIKNISGVGQNLGDHVTYPGLQFIAATNSSNNFLDYILNLPYWFMSGKGVLSNLAGFESIGFINLENSNKIQPELELLFSTAELNNIFKASANIQDNFYNKLYENVTSKITWSIYPILLHPKSRGNVTLASKDPEIPPKIATGYFTQREDIDNLIMAIKQTLKFLETKEFQNIKTVLNPNKIPGCEFSSDNYWDCAIRQIATSAYNFFGTCKMGPESDPEAVVNSKLQLHGVKNLRVVDASVIPDSISGHILAATVMIAEKAADLIKNSHQ